MTKFKNLSRCLFNEEYTKLIPKVFVPQPVFLLFLCYFLEAFIFKWAKFILMIVKYSFTINLVDTAFTNIFIELGSVTSDKVRTWVRISAVQHYA